ncbi:MAG: DNA-directed RNA polymerase subunit alpha [Synergistaceae bacterium]|nr:DNA-directed RNA polymerase subunit alpha [Synergistaceae bacterium]
MESTKFKVYIEEKSQDYGRIYIEPLERGYGDTLGNALRRLLLSSIRGAAVTAVRIDGILHEFSTIKGVREDVIEILMNLKHIPIKARNTKDGAIPEGYKIITLDSDDLPKDFFTREENPGVITAKDMPWDNDFEFFGDGILCTLEPKSHILMEIYVEQGVGYLSAERERPANPPLPVDAMLADAIFSPVKRVNYTIQPARVGQSIDYERLIIEVWTNGAVTPEEAVKEAARIAENCFGHIANTVESAPQAEIPKYEAVIDDTPKTEEPPASNTETEDTEHYSHPIHELELSIRSENCLLRGGIQTVGELLQRSKEELLKIRNLGKISLKEIEERLTALGYKLKPSAEPQEAQPGNQADEPADSKPESEPEESEPESETKE